MLVAAGLMGLAATGYGAAAVTAEMGVDPARTREIAAMLPQRPEGIGRPIADRAAWEAIASQPRCQAILEAADKLLAEPLPQTSDDLYLEYSRTGNRTHWQDVAFKRRARLDTLVLAECIENKGRYVAAMAEAIRSICAEQTWIYPAHDGALNNFHSKEVDVDLGSAALGWTLGTTDWLLGDRLDASVRELIRSKVRERVLDPFKETIAGKRQGNWWIMATNNWNAVCFAGVTGAALTLVEPGQERAFYVACAEKYTKHFLAGFAADGYCTEGVSYWGYGFGHYLMLAETVWQATGGRLDLLAGDKVRRPALYGTKIEIVPGVCPAFADCHVDAHPQVRLLDYVSRRWGVGVASSGAEDPAVPKLPASPLYDVVLLGLGNTVSLKTTSRPAAASLPERCWFESAGVLIDRPGDNKNCLLAAALKGGHNAENHNHNDVGSYVVVVGRQLVLVDPGAEVYTRRTFSEHRYDSKVINSFGHPVPMVAGKLQRPGAAARGRVVRTEFTDAADTLVLDIRSAYDVPELEKLDRTFVYSRGGAGSLTVADDVAFKSPQAFGTAIITFGRWQKLGQDKLRIEDGGEAVEVAIHATGGDIAVQAEEIHEDLLAKQTPTRIGIDFVKPVANGNITVRITPAGK